MELGQVKEKQLEQDICDRDSTIDDLKQQIDS